MKKRLLFLSAFLGLLLLGICSFIPADEGSSEGINFLSISLDKAKEMAAEEDKLIFIDVMTSWCGPCKMMAKSTFQDAEVGEFYNEHFICLKLDAEKTEDGRFVDRAYRVKGYPTLLFIDSKGKSIKELIGYHDASSFLSKTKSLAAK